MCNAPRPLTVKESDVLPASTLRARFFSSSLSNLSLMFRVVTYFPSLPAKGEVLTRKVIRTVGSSTFTKYQIQPSADSPRNGTAVMS